MSVKLVQITDCHLGQNAGDRLLGLDTDQSLSDVLYQVHSEQKHIDWFLCTGDLSNDAGSTAYERLIAQLPHHIPQAWLPGNHDENAQMAHYVSETRHFLPSLSFEFWQITLLDSSIPHAVPGLLAPQEIDRLVAILQANPHKSHMIFLHHPLLPVGCAWLDEQVVANGREILALLATYPQVKAVMCGHVHQEHQHSYQHIALYSTPSTCIQFKPNSQQFAVGDEMPGYRFIELFDDGTFATLVSRIPYRELFIDHHSKGY